MFSDLQTSCEQKPQPSQQPASFLCRVAPPPPPQMKRRSAVEASMLRANREQVSFSAENMFGWRISVLLLLAAGGGAQSGDRDPDPGETHTWTTCRFIRTLVSSVMLDFSLDQSSLCLFVCLFDWLHMCGNSPIWCQLGSDCTTDKKKTKVLIKCLQWLLIRSWVDRGVNPAEPEPLSPGPASQHQV